MSTKAPTKLTSERSNSFKKKDSGIDKRNLRAHRRSIEWKQRREETVNQRRGDFVSPLSPLKEFYTNIDDQACGPIKALVKPSKPIDLVKTKAQKASEERREMLEKWRKEKELKKKLESQENAKKKSFKVAHVDKALLSNRKFGDVPKQHPMVTSKKSPIQSKGRKALPKSPKLLASTNKRVTRSQTSRTVETKPQKIRNVKPAPKKEVKPVENKNIPKSRGQVNVGRQTQPSVQSTTSHLKSVDTTKKKPMINKTTVNKPSSKTTTRTNQVSAAVKRDHHNRMQDSITCFRGNRFSSSEMSFAPSDFKFSAPSSLQSFVFQPLSPKSAAGFLHQGNDLSKLTPPSTKRCSTPISRSKALNSTKNLSSSGSSGDEHPSKSGSSRKSGVMRTPKSQVSKSKGNGGEEPVLCVEQEALNKKGKEIQEAAGQGTQAIEVDRQDVVVASQDAVEKNSLKKAEAQKTPARRKSLRKSHTSEPMAGLKCVTQSLPDAEMYGSKSLHGDSSNLENQPPALSEAGGPLPDNVFRTPAPLPSQGAGRQQKSRGRTRSLGTALLLSNSAKKRFRTPRNNRNSLILSTLSPEEGMKVLENSPMIELTRRTPKLHKSPAGVDPTAMAIDPMPSFDDIEEELEKAEQVAHRGNPADSSAVTTEASVTAEMLSEDRVQTDSALTVSIDEASKADNTVTRTIEDSSQTTLVVDGVTQVIPTDDSTMPLAPSDNTTIQHDIAYFRQILVTETQKLRLLCDQWEGVNSSSPELSEEVSGEIRTTIGKAQLLMAQRFKQFSGLVDNCEFKTGEKETTCTDLDGFWEMIYFQVEDVHNMFAVLSKKQANGWKNDEKTQVIKKKIVKKKATGNAKPSKVGAKSKFAEFRAKMKKQATESTEQVVENKTFVSGIFRIDSPVKKISPHCAGGSPGKLVKRVSSRGNTPCGSPLLKSVIERNARKSHGPSPLLQDITSTNHTGVPKTPAAQTENKRKRNSSSDSNETPSKVSRVEDVEGTETAPKVIIEGRSIFSPDPSSSKKSSRRSLRRSIRKSVSWDKAEVSDSPLKNNSLCEDTSETQSSTNIMSLYLQPTCMQESNMEVDTMLSPPEDVDMSAVSKRALHSEFDKHSASAKKAGTPRRRSVRLLSSEKSLSCQRKTRRSVHFSTTQAREQEDSPVASRLPLTPFHRDNAVLRVRRSSRQSVGDDDGLFSPVRASSLDTSASSVTTTPVQLRGGLRTEAEDSSPSPATRLAQLNMSGGGTPREGRRTTRGNKRVSGFTPPPKISPPLSSLDSVMETNDLMSFSPVPSGSSGKGTPRTPRRSLRPRVSLL